MLFYFAYVFKYWKYFALLLIFLNVKLALKLIFQRDPVITFNKKRPLTLFMSLYELNLINAKNSFTASKYTEIAKSTLPYFFWSLILGFSFRFLKFGVGIFISFKESYEFEEMYAKRISVWPVFLRKSLTKFLIHEFNPPLFLKPEIEVTVFGKMKRVKVEVIEWDGMR